MNRTRDFVVVSISRENGTFSVEQLDPLNELSIGFRHASFNSISVDNYE